MKIHRAMLHCLVLLAVGARYVESVETGDAYAGSRSEERSGSAASATDGSAGAPSPSPSTGGLFDLLGGFRGASRATSAPSPSPTPTPTSTPTEVARDTPSTTPEATPSPTTANPDPSSPATPEPTPSPNPSSAPGPSDNSISSPPTEVQTLAPQPDDSLDSPSPPPIRPIDFVTTGDPSTQVTPTPLLPPSVEEPSSPSPPRAVGHDQLPNKPDGAIAETREAKQESPTPTTSPVHSVEQIATPTPTVLDLSAKAVGSESAHQKPYRRGDSVLVVQKKREDGTTVKVEVVVSGSNAPSVLARGANTLSSDNDDTSDQKDANVIVRLLRIAMPLLAAMSLGALIVFHFVALRPAWTASMSIRLRPNQWELLVFITYIQAMASVAHYIIASVPVSMWKFLDGFSWTVFIPIHHSESGVGSIESSSGRRLSEVVILNGLVAFADRIGVNEAYLLQTSVAGLVVLFGIVIPLAFAILLLIRHWRNASLAKKNPVAPFDQGTFPRTLAENAGPEETESQSFLILRGLVVVLGAIALYPITMLASFEILSQIRAHMTASNSLAIAVLALFMVPVLLIARSISVLDGIRSEAEFKNEPLYRAVWGVFCSSFSVKYNSRVLITAAWLGMQIASALIVGTLESAGWQLVCLLVIDAGFVGFVLLARPFAQGHQVAAVATVAIGLIKALNTGLAFSFLGSHKDSLSRRQAVAAAFIAINSLVIALWFIRIASIALRLLRAYAAHRGLFRRNARDESWSPSDGQLASALYVELPPLTKEGRRHAVL